VTFGILEKVKNDVYKNNTCTDNDLKGMVRRPLSIFARQEIATVLVNILTRCQARLRIVGYNMQHLIQHKVLITVFVTHNVNVDYGGWSFTEL